MIQYTTPTHEFVVEGIDLSGCEVWVSYAQKGISVDVQASSVTYDDPDTTVEVDLTQEQTGKFQSGQVQVQLNWLYPNGKRDAVEVKNLVVDRNLIARPLHA